MMLSDESRKQIASAVVALGFVLLVGFTRPAWSQGFHGKREVRPYTVNLPVINRVELLKLKIVGDWWNGDIEGTRSVAGPEAQKIASLWRAQTYLPYSAICHLPAYAIKFYYREKLITYATVCWECNNIAFQEPDLKGSHGFGGKDRKGKRLLKVFRAAFHEIK